MSLIDSQSLFASLSSSEQEAVMQWKNGNKTKWMSGRVERNPASFNKSVFGASLMAVGDRVYYEGPLTSYQAIEL